MLKKLLERTTFSLMLICTFCLNAKTDKQISYSAKDWIIKNTPASNNKNKTIYMFKDEAQCLFLVIKTTEKNIIKDYKIKLKTCLPKGTRLYGASCDGNTQCDTSSKISGEVEEFTIDFKIRKGDLQPKEKKERAEWKSVRVALKLPENSRDYWKLKIKMFADDHYIDEYCWPVKILKKAAFKGEFKKLRMGLWDYGTFKCGFAAEDLIDFYKSVGINYNQKPFWDTKKKTYEEKSFTVGCSTHSGYFTNRNFLDVNYLGKKINSTFPDPQAINDEGGKIIQPAINRMVKAAESYSGIATIDYEPSGLNSGFSDRSIKAFCKKENLSKDAFNKFHQQYKKLKYTIYKTDDPFIKKIYIKWVQFRSNQIQNLAGIISKGIKEINPKIKFEITCTPAFGKDDVSTLAEGADNAEMAKYIDGIMPQFYSGGYGGAVAKNVALVTRKWKEQITKLNKRCKLYPLLLIRYSGAKVFNTPARIRQQTLGSIAEGADGIVYYYVQQFDAKYWNVITKTNNVLRIFEDFYFNGIRVDKEYKPENMLKGSTEITVYPGYKRIVKNPNWHYTAHAFKGKVLLTLFNYSDNDVLFSYSQKLSIKKLKNCNKYASGSSKIAFMFPPQEVGFVVLKNTTAKK